jgi:S-adenosylmethionine hydrolase
MTQQRRPPYLTFLTDFGAIATAPAVCRGVILDIAPDAVINDLSHAVTPFDIREGAFLLAMALPYQPVGVHLVVVDPGVGTPRRPIGIRTGRGDVLIGPDNGVLRPAAEALGGVAEVRALENQALWLQTVSTTFHGRDIFSPVAAHVAAGTSFDEIGPEVDGLVDLNLPTARRDGDALETAVLFIDTFGNCRLAGSTSDLGSVEPGQRFTVRAGGSGQRATLPWYPTFGAVAPGDPLLYEDADYAGLGLAVNQGSAAERFGLVLDAPVLIEPA